MTGTTGVNGQSQPPAEVLRRCDILGVRVVAGSMEAVTATIEVALSRAAREALCLCPVDVHCVLEARKDPELARFLDEAAFTVADGMPLVRVERWMGFPQAERARGADLMWRILERIRGAGLGHFPSTSGRRTG